MVDMIDAEPSALHAHAAAECPECFVELQDDRGWWQAKPKGARLVGLVVSRDDMPSIVQQREDLAAFGVPIDGFRHPAPDVLESWEQRLTRLFDTLRAGDVLVVADIRALGRDVAEGTRTVAALGRKGIMVKVLSHGARHLHDAAG